MADQAMPATWQEPERFGYRSGLVATTEKRSGPDSGGKGLATREDRRRASPGTGFSQACRRPVTGAADAAAGIIIRLFPALRQTRPHAIQ
jgi:hypothetical protein